MKYGVKYKLISTAAVVGFILSIIQATILSFNTFTRNEELLREKSKEIFEMAAPSAGTAVYNFDKALAKTLLNGFSKFVFIQEAKIFDDNGKLFAEKKYQVHELPNFLKKIFSNKSEIIKIPLMSPNNKNDKMGVLMVTTNYAAYYEELLTESFFIFITGLLLALLLIFVIFVSVDVSIVQPLISLEREAKQISEDSPIVEISNKSNDELGTLAMTLNEMQLRLKDYIDNLEFKIKERTVDYKRAQEAANKANEAKSEFLANMSHEIRTPMNAVIGFAEVLKDKLLEPQLLHYAEAIYTSGKALVSIINDVLDLSKIEAGKLDIHYTAVSIQQTFKEVKQIFQQKMLEKGLDFVIEVTSEVPDYLILDSVRLRQILINMVGNSIKFTNNGFIRLKATTVATEYLGENSVTLQLIIEDTGRGIPKDQQDSIFNSFEQVKGQSVEEFGGTGLGLAITKKLLKLMNGAISVESEVGKGTKFLISLKEIEVAPAENILLELEKAPEVEFKPATILITDDIDFNRDLIRAYLDDYNFKFMEATNGEEAVRMTKEFMPDIVLMDIKMPVMTGDKAIEILKADPQTKDIPTIVVTASTSPEQKIILEKMSDGYLIKPLSKSLLITELMKFLKHKELQVDTDNFGVETDILDKLDIESELKKVPSYLVKDLAQLVSQSKYNSKFNELLIEMSVYSTYLTAKIERHLKKKEFSEIEKVFEKL